LKTAIAAFVLFLTIAFLVQCPSAAQGKMLVVVSILPQLEFAQRTAGPDFEVLVLIPPGASPHTFEMTPSQMRLISQAKAYFKVGSGLTFEEVWLSKITGLNPNMLVVDCSKGVEILSGEEGHGEEVEEHADGTDPHIWCSPMNAQIMVANMLAGFIAIDPEREAMYRRNAAVYSDLLDDLNLEIEQIFKDKIRRKFIVHHPSWAYLARDYELIQIPIEIEGKEPKASGLRDLVKIAKEEGISVVFAAPQFNYESAKVIAKEIGGRVEFIDSLDPHYLENTLAVASKLASAMQSGSSRK